MFSVRTRLMTGLGVLLAASAIALPASASGSDTAGQPTAAAQVLSTRTVQSHTAASADPCGYTAVKPADNFKGIPVFDAAKAARPFKVGMFTTQGYIEFQALSTKAPCTTYSFRFLAERFYYNLTHCHRLTTQRLYVLQCGDPTGTGSGGPGYQFNDENLDGASYEAGTVAMANAGPNTNGSQIFFTWKDTTLKPNYTPFGKVTRGMDVLRKIAAAGEDDQNGPGDGYPNARVDLLHVQVLPAV